MEMDKEEYKKRNDFIYKALEGLPLSDAMQFMMAQTSLYCLACVREKDEDGAHRKQIKELVVGSFSKMFDTFLINRNGENNE